MATIQLAALPAGGSLSIVYDDAAFLLDSIQTNNLDSATYRWSINNDTDLRWGFILPKSSQIFPAIIQLNLNNLSLNQGIWPEGYSLNIEVV